MIEKKITLTATLIAIGLVTSAPLGANETTSTGASEKGAGVTVAAKTGNGEPDASDSTNSNADVAKAAYDPEDTKPTENWFGCPPEKESEDQRTQPNPENCDAKSAEMTSTTEFSDNSVAGEKADRNKKE